MSQDLLSLTSPKAHSARARMSSCCLTQYGCIGFRFLRYRCSPWLALAIAPFEVILASGVQRTHARIRCMKAISRIDFTGVYGLLNDFLW